MLIPPLSRNLMVYHLIACLPVSLERAMVSRTVICPRRGVYVRVVVILGARDLESSQEIFPITVSAREEGTRLRPELSAVSNFARLLSRPTRVVSSPVTSVARSAEVNYVRLLVEGLLTDCQVEVRMIISVGAVSVVATRSVDDRLANVVYDLLGYQVRGRRVVVTRARIQVLLRRTLK